MSAYNSFIGPDSQRVRYWLSPVNHIPSTRLVSIMNECPTARVADGSRYSWKTKSIYNFSSYGSARLNIIEHDRTFVARRQAKHIVCPQRF
jgi:hypothetical protein